jgi:hypothetical protein
MRALRRVTQVGIVFASVLIMLWDSRSSRTPQFKVGDHVIVIGPGIDKGKEGVVIEVIGHTGDFVYRYSIRFSEGTTRRYFGFEIDFAQAA